MTDLPPTSACFDCEHQGFIVIDGGADVERCDACLLYPSDDEALASAVETAAELLKTHAPHAGTRFDKLLEALHVAAATIRRTD